MATTSDLPCDGEGVCMICKVKPSESESIICNLCTATWHVPCLACPLESMASAVGWNCPDCSSSTLNATTVNSVPSGVSSGLITSIKAIEADRSLSEREKAKKRQELVGGCGKVDEEDEGEEDEKKKKKKNGRSDVLDLLDAKFNCSFCMQLPERPVTTPCGHNFCLKCFQKWTGQGKNTCVKCRASIPSKMASNPRINSALVVAIRMAKAAKLATSGSSNQVYHFIHNDNRPDKAFTTERAKKSGKANACSGQIFVTIPPDYLGPITAEYDPRRNQGVLVGETWEDRMECRQWGAHFPHVAGIAGQSDYGAQSVALSGGYEDDEDHGDWFLYTGSGGRDLSGNKRTNKEHAFDQKFEKPNEALRVSCLKGYPVRVVRSHKEKNSSYAPETGVRYDGVYRIEKCWRKVGRQGFKMCRYLFVRCDNEPAPWACDEHGDKPRPLPIIKELKHATDITERKGSPAWDFDEKNGWKWMKSPPLSKKPVAKQDLKDGVRVRKVIRHAHNTSVRGRLLKEFSCLICRKVMKFPLTTPCAHNFCKCCLLDSYADLSFVKERSRENGRTLRAQKVVNKCPCCPTDISEFLQNPQVNTDMMNLIESLEMEQEEKDVEETSVEASIESNDPEEATKSTQGANVAKGPADGEKKVEEEFNVIEPNGEESDAAEDRKPSTSTKNCVQSSHCNLEEDGIAFHQPPITTTSPIPSAKNKHLSGEEMPTKKMKRDGKDTILDADHDKMVEAQNADSDVNATNFRQDEAIVAAGHSPNVQSDLLDSRKRKRPIAIAVPQSGPGVRTRRIVAKADVVASGRRTRSMSSNAISAHHSPIKCVAL